jgi:hypothetical protein
MRKLVLAAAAVFPIVAGSSVASDEAHPGWPTAPLLEQMARLGVNELALTDEAQLPGQFLFDPTEEAACFLAAGEKVRAFKVGEHSSGVLIGDDERTHTLYFYYPVLNDREEAGKSFYPELFSHLMPDWEGASTWYGDSLGRSWQATGRAMIDPTVSHNEMIARHAEGDVRLATFGVPPDIVFYRVTSRPECEKISPFLLASPREISRNEALRQPAQKGGQLLLSYVHPEPVDVSATPVLLGTVYARNRHGGSKPTLSFEPPGVEVDMAPWINRQVVTERYASTLDAVTADWGYTSHFVHLIAEPALPIDVDGEAHLLVFEALSAEVRGPLANGLIFTPMNAEAVLFAAKSPAGPSETPVPSDTSFMSVDMVEYRNQLPELPEASVSCGIEIPCGQRPFYLPVDVSATPIHLGRLHLYYGGHSGDRPGYYEVRVEGMKVMARDRETGEEAVLDFAGWTAEQDNFEGPPGGRTITAPALTFAMKGKRHVLVVESATFDRAGDGEVNHLTGQLFSER